VLATLKFTPTPKRPVGELARALDTKQQELVRHPPVVAHPQLRFDPHEATLVFEAPGFHDFLGVEQES
jgi:hypothetical protein